MRRTTGWEGWAWPARAIGLAFAGLLFVLVAVESAGLGGLAERLAFSP